ncbi:MAG TPA: glucokinase [Vicinamibacteria bacterium]|jgi:glucokinase|nr:glucokinase [Vicinamibacteria bacterium]
MILAGDVGGTNTRLGVFSFEGGRLVGNGEEQVPSRGRSGLSEIVSAFLEGQRVPIRAAAFGIAGPVRGGRVEATNLPWVVDAQAMSRELGIPGLFLLNDLEANAWGIPILEPRDLLTLNPGDSAASGNAAIIAAGTGLGEAGLFWNGEQHVPFGTEGGHSSFAPETEREIRLLAYLERKYGHVSWERVLSGPGLVELYMFLRDTEGPEGEGDDPLQAPDPAAEIAARALAKTCRLCAEALGLFVELYGSEAGNVALKHLSTGGLYLGGGIAPKILEALKGPAFMARFKGKGRMEKLLSSMPVRIILNDKAGLLGAARCAALRGLSEGRA